MTMEDELESLLFEHEWSQEVGKECGCGMGRLREVACEDCQSGEVVCRECFVETHHHTPFHWPRVWDGKGGFFARRDISMLWEDRAYSIPLGHNGFNCSHHSPAMLQTYGRKIPIGVKFTVVHNNGIHGTRVLFCSCSTSPSKTTQLIRSRLFPASVRNPITATTFSALHLYRTIDLVAKGSAEDFLRALQRMTDETRYWDNQVWIINTSIS